MSSIRQFTTRFSKIWTGFSSARDGNLLLVTGEDMLFHFDFARDIVILNPNHVAVRDFQTFKLYVTLFSEYYKINSEAMDETSNWWHLAIEAANNDVRRQLESLKLLLSNRIESLSVKTSNDGVQLQMDMVIDAHRPAPEVGDLKKVFGLASGKP
jgi:hypothetical protein